MNDDRAILDKSLADDTIALRPKHAAKALGVSARTLFDWTKAGIVPHVRVGGCVLYCVDDLRDWLRARTAKGAEP